MQSSPSFFNKNEGEKSAAYIEGIKNTKGLIEVEPRFKQVQKDLQALFMIEVTSVASLQYPWVKDEFYTKAIESLQQGDYATLDYMIREKLWSDTHLLAKEDCLERGIRSFAPQALQILAKYKEPRRTNIKDLFVKAGIFDETEKYPNTPRVLH